MAKKPEEHIIKVLKGLIETIQPSNGDVRYDEAPVHPLTGSWCYTIGMSKGRLRTLDDLNVFLGEHGYIDSITWRPFEHDGRYLQLTIHHGGGALSVTNCFRQDMSHFVGLSGAKWMPERSTPDHEVDPDKVRHHILETEEELVERVLDLLKV
ncbi:MAG: hypothetical protein JWN75_883 [Candidatus Saccharibacteria bacterium]|nr:hypothetical protein [Candidatus Saccharibacteria bacterium]